MKTGHIEIFVKDPAILKNFYTDVLEFELIEVQQDTFVWLNQVIYCYWCVREQILKSNKNEYAFSNFGIVLYTDNIFESAVKMRRKGLVFKGTDGSENCLTFSNPDENWFQLVNPNYR